MYKKQVDSVIAQDWADREVYGDDLNEDKSLLKALLLIGLLFIVFFVVAYINLELGGKEPQQVDYHSLTSRTEDSVLVK